MFFCRNQGSKCVLVPPLPNKRKIGNLQKLLWDLHHPILWDKTHIFWGAAPTLLNICRGQGTESRWLIASDPIPNRTTWILLGCAVSTTAIEVVSCLTVKIVSISGVEYAKVFQKKWHQVSLCPYMERCDAKLMTWSGHQQKWKGCFKSLPALRICRVLTMKRSAWGLLTRYFDFHLWSKEDLHLQINLVN